MAKLHYSLVPVSVCVLTENGIVCFDLHSDDCLTQMAIMANMLRDSQRVVISAGAWGVTEKWIWEKGITAHGKTESIGA